MPNKVDDIILRSWGNIGGILGPWFIEVNKKNIINPRKTLNLVKQRNFLDVCNAAIFITTTK